MIAPTELPPFALQVLGESPGIPALTPAAGLFLAESAAVCFEEQGHSSGVLLKISGCIVQARVVEWPHVSEQSRRSCADLVSATENGAYGIAVLICRECLGLAAIERSRRGTGFDYWMGPVGALPFQKKARLEVSGILHGTEAQIAGRIKQKLRQTARSDSSTLPAYVVVVEFSRPAAWVESR